MQEITPKQKEILTFVRKQNLKCGVRPLQFAKLALR